MTAAPNPATLEIRALRAGIQALRVVVGTVFAATVFDNLRHHGYDEGRYRALIDSYLRRGHQPEFHRAIMRFVRDNASVTAPMQEVGEIAIAVGLLAGIAVPIVSAASALLLGGLALSETAVYWTWELWPLVAIAAVVAATGVARLPAIGLRAWLVERPDGGRIVGSLPIPVQLALAAAVGATAWLVVDGNRQPNEVSTRTGLAITLLLVTGVVLDTVTRGGVGVHAES